MERQALSRAAPAQARAPARVFPQISAPGEAQLRALSGTLHDSPHLAAQRKISDAMHASPRMVAQRQLSDTLSAQRESGFEEDELLQGRFDTLQRAAGENTDPAPRENNTGLPDNLKSGVESLSGVSLDNVKVHYNSSQPAQLNALAYAQGSDIHVAPGQEQHLPHEAWHVAQQAQGCVQPTMQLKIGVPVNDDTSLEREADVMGQKALTAHFESTAELMSRNAPLQIGRPSPVVQRVVYPTMAAMWAAVHPGYALANIQQDSVLSAHYDDAAAQLPNCDFVQVPGTAPQITSTPAAPQPFRIDWDTAANLGLDNNYFAGAVIHELAHAASSQQYRRNANQGDLIYANMNLPVAAGAVNPATGLTPNQTVSDQAQVQTMVRNWTDLDAEALADSNSGALPAAQYNLIAGRIQYAGATSFLHNDTVLGDILYYLKANNLENTRTYAFARRMLKEANDRRRNGFWSRADTEARTVDRNAWWFQFWKW